MYIVELENGIWIRYIKTRMKLTKVKSNARRYVTLESARAELSKASKKYLTNHKMHNSVIEKVYDCENVRNS